MDELSPELYKKLIKAIESNRKVFAVKIYKEATGVSLREAKQRVDELTAQRKAENPEQHAALFKETEPGNIDGILESIFHGKKIEAVKRYKETNGCSLKEAKDFIEELTDKLRQESPEDFVTPGKTGCLILLTASLVSAVSLISAITFLC